MQDAETSVEDCAVRTCGLGGTQHWWARQLGSFSPFLFLLLLLLLLLFCSSSFLSGSQSFGNCCVFVVVEVTLFWFLLCVQSVAAELRNKNTTDLLSLLL
jgi:hypothetical protein